jgi:predicted metal-dependent phosphoesterase TrpH
MKQDDAAMLHSAQVDAPTIKVDLHVHTCYSKDCLLSLEEVIATAQRQGLGALAVLDHNAIEGALALQALAPFAVIVGEEIYTTEGEIAGMFLRELIPPGLTPSQTVVRIQEQGGLVYIPHPFERIRQARLNERALMDILDHVDAIEVLNARVMHPQDNERAKRFAQAYDLPAGAGSDAHSAGEIGQAYVEMPPFTDPDSVLRSLSEGKVCGGLSLPHVHWFSTWAKIRKRLRM